MWCIWVSQGISDSHEFRITSTCTVMLMNLYWTHDWRGIVSAGDELILMLNKSAVSFVLEPGKIG